MAVDIPKLIRVIRIDVDLGHAMTIREAIIGNRRRHLSKRLTGSYTTRVESGTLYEIWPGNSIAWQFNGPDDDYPIDPTLPRWTLPGLDFPIWGNAIIHGWANGMVVDTTVTLQQVMGALAQIDRQQTRKSAFLSRI